MAIWCGHEELKLVISYKRLDLLPGSVCLILSCSFKKMKPQFIAFKWENRLKSLCTFLNQILFKTCRS